VAQFAPDAQGGTTNRGLRTTHGDFVDTAAIAQSLKAVFAAAGAARFGPAQREVLDQIAVKLARILCGDPSYADHWLDLAGYARLAGRLLAGRSV
jgi:hypothetical protein